jgi:exodeoxyribonuclease VII large subunit
MAFNDEELVRAIASSTKPIITGVGHERDVCLADLAADVRASTPSTAAKAAIPDILELENSLLPLKQGLERSYKSYLLALDTKEMEVQAKKEGLQKLRNGLSSLRTDLDRSYDAYLLGLKIREKDEEIKQAGGKPDLLKYKVVILALIALLVLIILIFLLRG